MQPIDPNVIKAIQAAAATIANIQRTINAAFPKGVSDNLTQYAKLIGPHAEYGRHIVEQDRLIREIMSKVVVPPMRSLTLVERSEPPSVPEELLEPETPEKATLGFIEFRD